MNISFEERRLIELFRRCSDEGKEGLIVSAEVLAGYGQKTLTNDCQIKPVEIFRKGKTK